ncbi:MAG: D-aminoacylase [Pyrinomonadaceae bacterium]|nr:D-aminoacylase [Pyrinomonadaceae bacterium]MBP6213940.1 D-aminoacylase [Pyrinomonadaceae bacterium]
MFKRLTPQTLIVLCLTFFAILANDTFAQEKPVVFKNATIIDGSGRAAFRGDVRIKSGKIVKIGSIKPSSDDDVVDASGLVLAPGFIDIHNHSESGLLKEGTAANQVSQGITTILVGPDGGSPFPIKDYLDKLSGKIAPNVGAFIGHAEVREQVMKKDYTRKATEEEIRLMAALVDQSMKEGAFGLSSGLEYDVGFSASTEEMVALARAAAKHKGIYMTHMRDEEEGMLDALRESILIGREAKLPVQISHIKMGNRNVWGKSAEAIAVIEEARKAGFDVTADAYPYTAWASTITVLVPSRKHEDRNLIATGLSNVGGADKVLVTSCSAHSDYEGKTLEEIAAMKNTTPVEIYIQIVKDGGAGVVCNSMNEADVKAFYLQPWVMASSDGGIGSRHPRGTGTFTRVLARFVRENKWFSLEEAVRKMSSMPAARLRLKDRGLIKKGMKADLVLFDADKVIDRATFAEPQTPSTGIRATFVDGVKVWDGEKITSATPGAILRRK